MVSVLQVVVFVEVTLDVVKMAVTSSNQDSVPCLVQLTD